MTEPYSNHRRLDRECDPTAVSHPRTIVRWGDDQRCPDRDSLKSAKN